MKVKVHSCFQVNKIVDVEIIVIDSYVCFGIVHRSGTKTS